MTQSPTGPQWRKSSYSNGAGGECVEVADLETAGVALRDSKQPQGPLITVRHHVWSGFLSGLRHGTQLAATSRP
ncbi:DUF397 domain-containing protein [Streptomyces hebeiensis]